MGPVLADPYLFPPVTCFLSPIPSPSISTYAQPLVSKERTEESTIGEGGNDETLSFPPKK